MSKIYSTSLFHFTSRKDVLFKILRTGLRYSYCYESFGNNKGMAIPMICFCDIPLMRSLGHRSKYGDYAIGFNKEYLMNHSGGNLNPIQYITSPFALLERNLYSDFIINHLKEGLNKILENTFEEYYANNKSVSQVIDEDLRYNIESLSISKAFYINKMAFTRHYFDDINGKKINNYEEREWRLVPYPNPEDKDYPKYIEKITEDHFFQSKEHFIETISKTLKSHIVIPSLDINNAITSIIVKNEKMVKEMIKMIMKSSILFGSKIDSNETKLHLISKLTSFQRIENDY